MGRRRDDKKSHHKRNNNPTAGGSSSALPPWIELPRDVIENILSRLGPILENAQKVCTTWRSVCTEPSIWRTIEMKSSGYKSFCRLRSVCRRVVDLSQGELIDINIDILCPGDLLLYISERSSRLKSLRISLCEAISSNCLTTAVSNFPELEVLHIFYLSFIFHLPFITAKEIEAIGISCPKLKSFAFNISRDKDKVLEIDENYALAIAKNMPDLHHLCLDKKTVSRQGVKAIFDGCLNLESLMLRDCLNVYSDNQSSGKSPLVISRGCEDYVY